MHTDAPTIRLLGAPQIDLEEGKDSLVLRCEADANPPASVVWKRAGRSEIASLQVSEYKIDKKKMKHIRKYARIEFIPDVCAHCCVDASSHRN